MSVNKFFHIIFIILLIPVYTFSQQRDVSGYISDAGTGESLIGVNIIVPGENTGTITNDYGYFNLKIPVSVEEIYVSFIGYKTDTIRLDTLKKSFLNVRMTRGLALKEVSVLATREKFNQKNEISSVRIPMKTVSQLPTFVGEEDIVRALQLMPGVKSGTEGKASLYIRGGSPDQNLILLDDVPVYNINHFGGFLSTFNSDAIKDFKLYKGGFPARYGSRLSSVVDVRMKDGDLSRHHVSGAFGLLSSKIMVEGPIIKDRSSFLLSFRKNTLPVFRLFFDLNLDYRFYDLNAKVNYRFDEKNKMYFSFYQGDDNVLVRTKDETRDIYSSSDTYTRWGNTVGSIRWNSMLTDNIFFNTILGYTSYRYKNGYEIDTKQDTVNESISNTFNSKVHDFFIRLAPEWYVASGFLLRPGIEVMHHQFIPGNTYYRHEKTGMDLFDLPYKNSRSTALEYKAFLENDLDLFSWFGCNMGIHFSRYSTGDKTYSSLEPRILANFKISEDFSVKAAYSEMQQYIHLLSYNGVGMPSDFWMPSTSAVSPQRSVQIATGLEYFLTERYKISIEAYQKEMFNLITFKPGESFAMNNVSWENKVLNNGNGMAKGVELLVQKMEGKTNGWIAIDLSKSERQFNEIMEGKYYPFKYDRRFGSDLVVIHSFNEKISLSAVWKYGSGYPVTLPLKKYDSFGQVVYVYSDINSFRMRDYHRLDVGVNFNKKVRWGERTWSISVLNVYNRQNPYYYYFDYEELPFRNVSTVGGIVFEQQQGNLKLYQQSLIPFFPSVSFKFKFK